MKLYKIVATEFDYEEYKAVLIIAENEKRALEIAKKGQPFDWKDPKKHTLYWEFKNHQYPLIVSEIDLNEEKVICSELISG